MERSYDSVIWRKGGIIACLLYLAQWTLAADTQAPRPRSVQVDIVNGTTINLKWEAPRESSEACPLKGYLVRLRTDDDRRAKKWDVGAERQSISLHDLQEDTVYHVSVVAVDCDGERGKPSKWVTVETNRRFKSNDDVATVNQPEERAPGKPLYVKGRSFPDSIILTWHAPIEEILVRGYMVGYGEGVPDVNWQYVDRTSRNVTIKNLKAAIQYVVSLSAFNNVGKGPVVYELVTTLAYAVGGTTASPMTPPVSVRAKVLSPTTVWLQWSDPTLGRLQQIVDNRYYNVHYQALPHGKTLSVIVKALHVVLYELTPSTEYSFRVRTVNEAQSSPFSLTVYNRTFNSAPETAPSNLEVLPSGNDSSSVLVRWKASTDSNSADISGYQLIYTSFPSKDTAGWTTARLDGKLSETIVAELRPNTTYYFRLQARNAVGYGPLSETVSHYVPPESRQSKPDGRLSGSDKVRRHDGLWEPSINIGSAIGFGTSSGHGVYQPLHRPKPGTTNGVQTAARKLTSDELQAADSSREGETEDPSRPLELLFSTIVRHTVSVVISWNFAKPQCPADTEAASQPSDPYDVTYKLRFYDTQNAKEAQDILVNANFVLLENLQPNRIYKYQVQVVAESGQESSGNWSKESVIDTNNL